jgi:hypothetical protein
VLRLRSTNDDFEILPCLQVEFLVCGSEDGAVDGCQVEWWGFFDAIVVRGDHSPRVEMGIGMGWRRLFKYHILTPRRQGCCVCSETSPLLVRSKLLNSSMQNALAFPFG